MCPCISFSDVHLQLSVQARMQSGTLTQARFIGLEQCLIPYPRVHPKTPVLQKAPKRKTNS